MKRLVAVLLAAVLTGAVLCACGGSTEQKNVTVAQAWDKIKAEVTFESFDEFANINTLGRFYGITEDMAAEYAGGINNSGVNQEEVVLVKAKDDAGAVQIKKALDTRFASKLAQNQNYNAEQAKMIEGCKVEQNGMYITMIVSDNAEKITQIFKSELGL